MSGEDGNGNGNGGAEFQAGVAAATAANAAEDAQEAQDTAESAQATAETAVDIALDASGDAWDARVAVDELRGDMRAGFDEIKEILGSNGKPNGDGPPAPEPKIKDEAPPATEEKAPEQEKSAKGKGGLGMWRS